MELVPEPDQDKIYENVCFIDEYPDLEKRVWLRRLDAQRRVGQLALFREDEAQLLLFPDQGDIHG